MVDQAQIGQITALFAEYRQIDTVAQMFAAGHAKIVGVIFAPDVETEEGMEPGDVIPGSVMVRTNRFDLPAQITNGFKTQLLARQNAIREELRHMGVTGLAV